jgi:hypothetical protein
MFCDPGFPANSLFHEKNKKKQGYYNNDYHNAVLWTQDAAVPCSAKMLSQLVMGFFKANLRLPALWLSCGSGQMDHLQSAACVYIQYELITYNIRIYDYTYNISLSLFLFICKIYCHFFDIRHIMYVYIVYIYIYMCV